MYVWGQPVRDLHLQDLAQGEGHGGKEVQGGAPGWTPAQGLTSAGEKGSIIAVFDLPFIGLQGSLQG